MSNILVKDEKEKDSIIDMLVKEQKLGKIEKLEIGFIDNSDTLQECYSIGIRQSEISAGSSYHTHSYMLAYAHINLMDELLKYDFSSVVKVKTDSIYRTKNDWKCEFGTKIGMWKVENSYTFVENSFDGKRETTRVIERVCDYQPDDKQRIEFIGNKRLLLIAAAGFGKSYMTNRETKGLKVLTLVPTRQLRKYLMSRGHEKVLTYQYAFLPKGKFDSAAVQIDVKNYDIIHWDEIGCVPKESLEPILKYLDENNVRLIFSGDDKQLPPFCGTQPWSLFDDWKKQTLKTDYRSKDDTIKKLKQKCRGLSNEECFAEIDIRCGTWEMEEFYTEWNPQDFVLVSTHEARKHIHKKVRRHS